LYLYALVEVGPDVGLLVGELLDQPVALLHLVQAVQVVRHLHLLLLLLPPAW
jgi:hypothetical protein